uniref:Tick transposon n=1 Tax=Rhipicephalus zambeziensis TaxID=60191 RepID=A0A224Z9X5_9ACAR
MKLEVNDPFLVRKSDDVIAFLNNCNDKSYMACSFDVKDLYYSLPHRQLMLCVEECIDKHGSIAFQNHTGLSVQSFLELLTMYLNSTFATWHDNVYIQTNGVCIGSSIAPILSDLFLAHLDRRLQNQLKVSRLTKVFRYVDDFLVIFNTDEAGLEPLMFEVLNEFRKYFQPLVLTYELPVGRIIRFLDIKLKFVTDHICWAYEPRASKPLLPFDSCH